MNLLTKLTLAAGGWDLGSFFSNLTEKGKEWGGYLLVFLGVVLIIVGFVKIVVAFVSKRSQNNWFVTIGMILVGGFLAAAGVGAGAFSNVAKLANVGSGTIESLGH